MRITYLLLVWLVCLGCSRDDSKPAPSTSGIESNHFAILETELTPAILVHSASKYLGLFADAPALSHIAFTTRNGPRSFRRAEKLKADELEECWLLLWGQNIPPWVVYLQHKPLALSLDTNGLHLSFANGADDVVLLPLHGTSTNIDTRKWPEFLTREPLLRIRYWAGVLREFPFECQTSIMASNTVHQGFRFHSIRDDWNTKPLRLAPISPPLAAMADEQLKRKLRDLKMPTPFGPYMGFEGASEWTASFASVRVETNCAWASLGECKVAAPNTALIYAIQTGGCPRIANVGAVKASRGQAPAQPKQTLLNPSSRVVVYAP